MIVYKEAIIDVVGWPNFETPASLPMQWTGESSNAEKLSEFAGRVCYMSQANPAGRTTEQYLHNILEQGHGSVLEHAVINVLLQGVSRSLTHELVRHRAGFAYSQLSQRYVDESDCAVVMPPLIQQCQKELQGAWVESMLQQLDEYRSLSNSLMHHVEGADTTAKRKAAREAARSVLPNATETKIVVSANIRAWRYLLELRGGLGADAEIRNLAIGLLPKLSRVAPFCFAGITIESLPKPAVKVAHSKV